MSQYRKLAALLVGAISLAGLSACSDSTPSVEATPKPTKTTPLPTRTKSPSPTPTPTPEPITFDVIDEEGYVYGYEIDPRDLPEYTATIDTTKGPPGYTMVAINPSTQVVPVQVTNKTPGGKEAPTPVGVVEIIPSWDEMKNSTCLKYKDRFEDLGMAHRTKDALCAWDWALYNLWQNSHNKYAWEKIPDWSEYGNIAIIGEEAGTASLNVSIKYENSEWNLNDKKGLHGDPKSYSDREEIYDTYVVQDDQVDAFVQTMLHPNNFEVRYYVDSGYMNPWARSHGGYEIKEIVPYKEPSGTLVTNGTILEPPGRSPNR